MKKSLLTFLVLVISTCIISTSSFAQSAPGDGGDGVPATGIDEPVTDVTSDPSQGITPAEYVTTHSCYFNKCQAKSTCNHSTRTCSHTQATPCTHVACYRSSVVDLFCKGKINFSSFFALYNYDPSKKSNSNSGCRNR